MNLQALVGRGETETLEFKEKGKITNKESRELTGLSDEGTRTDLNKLVDAGIFLVKGSGRGVHYVLK